MKTTYKILDKCPSCERTGLVRLYSEVKSLDSSSDIDLVKSIFTYKICKYCGEKIREIKPW